MAKGSGRRLGGKALAAAWAWAALVVAYVCWGAATERGLYGWLMRWQLERGDSYSGTFTFVLPIILLGLPSIWLLFGHFAAVEQEAARSAEAEKRYVLRWAIGTLALAGVSMAAGIGCGVMAAQVPGREAPVEIDAAELVAGRAPPGRLSMTGEPVTAARYTITEHNRRTSDEVTVWQGFHPERSRPRDPLQRVPPIPDDVPVALFYEGRTSGGTEGRLGERMQITGRVVEGGLPEVARRGLAARGVTIAEPHVLLSDEEEGSGWLTGALLGFFFAFALGVIGGTLLLRALGAFPARR